ncbi:hypothetical protein H6G45_17265 [Synechocystis sp. FACHB-383]|uniref:hypothetical protein n=1 Tax=Synechocystis sp. FACHB-383 TaxID=2692864 RepID=UPI0016838F9B|nr:hypothetical protein [Synechocystis sp. FACHB-383]MBD2655200.1 hypothetical protein [Synechocystis sp. FACHB-383]
MPDSINEFSYDDKPDLEWVKSYTRGDGVMVDGYYRTESNESIADNLNTDIDGDGILGYFDADEDGDGILESADIDRDGIADLIQDFLEDIFN